MTLFTPKHFRAEIRDRIARIAHDRPDRKNPFTFDSYAEFRDWFRALAYAEDVHAVAILPNGGNFSSGGDVHDIIGPLTRMSMKELLNFTRMTGRAMCAEEGLSWGFFNRIVSPDTLKSEAITLAERITNGPTFANSITKTMLAQEWSMSIEQAIEAEAQAQAICMQGKDFQRAYEAFVAKEKPVFEGN